MAEFPWLIQATLLFDRPNPVNVETLVDNFVAKGPKAGVRFRRLETKPGTFHRLVGGDVMITVEYIGNPAKTQVFENALSSSFTQFTNPNARTLIARHRSHIIVSVNHGALQQIAALLGKMDASSVIARNQSPEEFSERLSLCGMLSRLAHEMGKASLVHWSSSAHLLQGDVFGNLAAGAVPSLLHVHPFLGNCGKTGDGRDQFEIRTVGALFFVGREVHLAANPLPWQESLGFIVAFLKLATLRKGRVIPHGDTFGTEDRCRVLHIPEGARSGIHDGPLYRLEVLNSRKHSFVASDDAAPARTFNDRTAPADILSDLGPARPSVAENWCAKREIVDSIDGRLNVSETAPPRGAWGALRAFGRKKPQGDT